MAIVGGGPAGAATAIFLRQAGRDVVVLEEASFPRDKICGESASPEAWPLLESLGAAGGVRGLSPHPLHGMTLTAPDGTVVRGSYDGRTGFAAERRELDAVLLETARKAGAEVRERARVSELVLEKGRVCGVALSGGEMIRARIVVGADGRRSIVARRLGLLREHPSFRKFAVRGYFEGVQGLEERGEMHVGGGGYCGVAPLSPTRANVTFVLDRRALPPARGRLTAFYLEALNRWPRLRERLSSARLEGEPRVIGPLALVAKRVSSPGALVVGDAAGFFDPFTGEGVTLALRSAQIASEVAHRSLSSASGDLGEYDRLRGVATRDKFRFNRLLQLVVGCEGLANAVGRRLARRSDLADELVRIAGDFVPAGRVFRPGFLLDLLRA